MTNPNDPVGTPPPTPTPPPAVPPAAPPAAPAPATPGVTSEQDAKTFSMLAHFLNITLLGPLIIYFVKKGQNAYLDTEAKEALNFSLTCFIAHIVLGVVTRLPFAVCIALPISVLLSLAQIILGIMGGLQARDGKPYKYPFSIKFIK